jgi:phenylalanyl-tRNA synthetase alpha subunit
MKLNKDYDSMDQDQLLFEYRKNKDKYLDEDDIKFDLETQFGYDPDYEEEKEIKKKQLAKKKELTKAKEYFNNLKEQYKVPLESRESFVPQEEKEAYEAYKSYKQTANQADEEQAKRSKYFTEKTSELFSDKFEGFGFSIDENKKVVYKPAEAPDLLKDQSNLQNFVSKFLNDEGYLKDAEAFHRAIAVASNPEKFAKFFYEKGMADAVDNVAKESKNIDMTRQATQVTPAPGFRVTAIDDNRGNRLVIRNKNKN